MIIYTCASESHEPLLEGWLRSCSKDPEISPVTIRTRIRSNGDYGNSEWMKINRVGASIVRMAIRKNIGTVVGTAGADVRFIRPFVHEIAGLIEGFDVLFQREREGDDLFNPDVAFWNSSTKMLRAWDAWMVMSETLWDGHLPEQNRLMREAFAGIKIGLLPHRYASSDNGGAEQDPVLFHANCTPPPNSVQKKLEMLKKYES